MTTALTTHPLVTLQCRSLPPWLSFTMTTALSLFLAIMQCHSLLFLAANMFKQQATVIWSNKSLFWYSILLLSDDAAFIMICHDNFIGRLMIILLIGCLLVWCS